MGNRRVTWENWRRRLEEDLARVSGQPVRAFRIEPVVLDNTDGTKYGLAFSHEDPALAERAAKYFAAWRVRHMTGLYDQHQVEPFGDVLRLPDTDLHAPGAYAAPYVYYPCGDRF